MSATSMSAEKRPESSQEPEAAVLLFGAIKQLKRSERGHAAAVAFRALIANGGGGLDTNNWQALETLCRACRLHGGQVAYMIRDALPPK